MKETLKASMEATGVIMLIGMLLFLLFPGFIMKLFDANQEMVRIGVPMLRIIAIGFLISTVGCVLSGAFEALGKGIQSLVISVLRQLVIIIPLAALLSKSMGLFGVWITFPIAEAFGSFCRMCTLRTIYEAFEIIGVKQWENRRKKKLRQMQ